MVKPAVFLPGIPPYVCTEIINHQKTKSHEKKF